jgi:hypothetical protein
MKLSERETAALLALADHDVPVGGGTLARTMSANGRPTSTAAAHQAANALANKGLAIKGIPEEGLHVRYEINNKGRELAARYRNGATAATATEKGLAQ